MRLLVTTPMSVVADEDDVRYVRAEDDTGAFGVLPHHADFVTVLSVSVITWRNGNGEEHHVAVRGGILTVRGGELVEVATREAVGEDTLRQLGEAVLERFREEAQVEEESRVSAARLHIAAIRLIQRYLESGRQSVLPGRLPTGARTTPGGGSFGEGGTA